ncbi:hypothetical protein ACWGBH_24590 [Streptomyces massasporeus]
MARSVGRRRDFTAPRDRRVANVRESKPPSGGTYGDGGSGKAGFTAYVGRDATRPIQLPDLDCGSGA